LRHRVYIAQPVHTVVILPWMLRKLYHADREYGNIVVILWNELEMFIYIYNWQQINGRPLLCSSTAVIIQYVWCMLLLCRYQKRGSCVGWNQVIWPVIKTKFLRTSTDHSYGLKMHSDVRRAALNVPEAVCRLLAQTITESEDSKTLWRRLNVLLKPPGAVVSPFSANDFASFFDSTISAIRLSTATAGAPTVDPRDVTPLHTFGQPPQPSMLQRHYAAQHASSANRTRSRRGWSSNVPTFYLQSSLLW